DPDGLDFEDTGFAFVSEHRAQSRADDLRRGIEQSGPLGDPGLSESGGDFGIQFDVELFEHVLLSGEELVERTAGDAGFLAQRLHTGPSDAIRSVQLEGRLEQTWPPGRIASCAQRAVTTVRSRIERRYVIHPFIIVKSQIRNAIQCGMAYIIRQ